MENCLRDGLESSPGESNIEEVDMLDIFVEDKFAAPGCEPSTGLTAPWSRPPLFNARLFGELDPTIVVVSPETIKIKIITVLCVVFLVFDYLFGPFIINFIIL